MPLKRLHAAPPIPQAAARAPLRPSLSLQQLLQLQQAREHVRASLRVIPLPSGQQTPPLMRLPHAPHPKLLRVPQIAAPPTLREPVPSLLPPPPRLPNDETYLLSQQRQHRQRATAAPPRPHRQLRTVPLVAADERLLSYVIVRVVGEVCRRGCCGKSITMGGAINRTPKRIYNQNKL